jgi:NtrC-family two-component system sensor histidine kinase KinB
MNEINEQEIQEYIDSLEDQNEFKSDLISTSAHQLRTSLTANKWALRMLVQEDCGEISDEQRKLLTKLSENNQQMIRTVTELIDVNHTEETHPKYLSEPVDLHKLLNRVIDDFQGEATEKDIAISFDETGENHILLGDEQKLVSVFQALLENALKYSGDGDSVMIHTETKEDEVVISIKDEGIGIPKKEQEYIFQKFYRAQNAQKKQSVGSGLGLFSAKHVIQAHRGEIWFDSFEGSGTTFYVSLPFPSVEDIVE